MPGEAIRIDAAMGEIPLSQIGALISKFVY